jgi:hypothetical protein
MRWLLCDQFRVERLSVMVLYDTSGDVCRWRFVTSQGRGRLREAPGRRLIVVLLMLAPLVCVLPACGDASPRSVRLGVYVSQLCEAIGPFEVDGQRLGRVISRHGFNGKSRRSQQATINVLTSIITDSRHVVATLDAVGSPDVGNGRALAAGMISTFDQIEQSDAAWRSELRAGVWAWPTTSRVKRERLRMSFEALLLVGHQIERLPRMLERQDAMAGSPVCRDVFGAGRVGAVLQEPARSKRPPRGGTDGPPGVS